MSDTLTEDDEIELVEVEEIPTGAAEPEPEQPSAPEPEDDDDDDEDERLADSQDDSEDEIVSRNRKKRQQRRQLRKAAQERAQREIQLLREQNDILMRRVSAVESNALDHNALRIDEGLEQAKRDAADAEAVLARAIENGNGEDASIALRMRDEAKARAIDLEYTKRQVLDAKSRPTGPDPQVKRLYDDWSAANPWYDPSGSDSASKLTNNIDAQVAAAGYDPKTPAYWEELSRRLTTTFNSMAPKEPEQRQAPARRPPPMGSSRDTPTVNSRTQVYVTPARRQAMEDAGAWDDVARRNRMLKAYAEYDRNNPNRA